MNDIELIKYLKQLKEELSEGLEPPPIHDDEKNDQYVIGHVAGAQWAKAEALNIIDESIKDIEDNP